MSVMRLPQADPRDAPAFLWALQWDLLAKAESALGPRDTSKKIYQPQFTDNGPVMRNTPNLDGAFAELSRDAESSWSYVIFELAHESVHLLNPIPGNTNNLEEGVAVAFSLSVQPEYGVNNPPAMKSYIDALQLVCVLPGGPLEAGRRVRERIGRLSAVTVKDLRALFPSVDRQVLNKLAASFIRDA